MRNIWIVRAVQMVCLIALLISSIACASSIEKDGVYIPWAAVTTAVAVVGFLGTLVGLVRRGDLARIADRCERHDQNRKEIVEWLQRVEKKLDDLIKEL